MVLQLDRIDCYECDNQLDLISLEGYKFPKGTIYIKSLKIPLENTPLRYHTFICKSCGKITKCIAMVEE